MSIKIMSDLTHEDDAYLYWIKTPEMSNISTEGYVGVTTNVRSRISQHNCKVRNHDRYYHGGFRRNFHNNNLECYIVDCGSEFGMYQKEFLLRPEKSIGWNYAVGGEVSGTSFQKFEIAGERFSYRKACKILGLNHAMVQKRISCYSETLEEAFGLTTKIDQGNWCNYPTKTGYRKFLYPLEQVELWSEQVFSLYQQGLKLKEIEIVSGCPQSIVKKLLTIDHDIKFNTEILNVCVDGFWFSIKTSLSPDDVYHIVQMKRRGVSNLHISEIYDVSQRTVAEILKKFVKSGGDLNIPKFKKYYNTDIDETVIRNIMSLKMKGFKNTEISDILGVDTSRISRIFNALKDVYDECFEEEQCVEY